MGPKKTSKKKKACFPSRKQWAGFLQTLNHKEKQIFFVLFLLFCVSFANILITLYLNFTIPQAKAGGVFREAVLGQVKDLNPLFLSSQDADKDIVELIYSGILKYNGQAELVYDLAKSYTISPNGKEIEVILKDNLFWQDKNPLTSDDILFTINLIQEPLTQSPLRIKWVGILVEKIDSKTILFKLPTAYNGFLENLTLKILPKHIFENTPPKNLSSMPINKNFLIGSGPYKINSLEQNKEGFLNKIIMEKNTFYHNQTPFIKKIIFSFFQAPEDILKEANLGLFDGFYLNDTNVLKNINNGFNVLEISIPRYFAIFFNEKSITPHTTPCCAELNKEIKTALAFAIDKERIVAEVFNNKANKADSPILNDFYGFNKPEIIYEFSQEQARQAFENNGWQKNEQTGLLEKSFIETDFRFNKNLTEGDKNKDVEELQKCLSQFTDVYPEGIISGYFGSQTKTAVIKFQEKFKADILDKAGLTKGNGEVKPLTRKKLNEVCFLNQAKNENIEITLTTSDKFPLNKIGEIIQENWQDIGIIVDLQTIPFSSLQIDVLAKRNFSVLIFGNALGAFPDPFPFWHSSQKDYPGLNITEYNSKQADKLLEDARTLQDSALTNKALENFQNLLIDDLPAIFLTSPSYIYVLSNKVKGCELNKIIEPAKRFSTIENWHIKTKRVFNF